MPCTVDRNKRDVPMLWAKCGHAWPCKRNRTTLTQAWPLTMLQDSQKSWKQDNCYLWKDIYISLYIYIFLRKKTYKIKYNLPPPHQKNNNNKRSVSLREESKRNQWQYKGTTASRHSIHSNWKVDWLSPCYEGKQGESILPASSLAHSEL